MKKFAFALVAASVAFTAPAMASERSVGSIYSYYSASERDQLNNEPVSLTKTDVKNVQLALKKAGYNPGKTDGVYGKHTTAAVKKFQKDRHLSGNGKITARTLGALRVSSEHNYDHKRDRNYND